MLTAIEDQRNADGSLDTDQDAEEVMQTSQAIPKDANEHIELACDAVERSSLYVHGAFLLYYVPVVHMLSTFGMHKHALHCGCSLTPYLTAGAVQAEHSFTTARSLEKLRIPN